MPTRVFRAPSLLDARQAATQALGSNAVILTTREVKRPGLLGFFGATEIEVAAASAPPPPTQPAPQLSARSSFAAAAYATDDRSGWSGDAASRAAVVNALRRSDRSEIRAVKLALGRPTRTQSREVAAIRDAIEQLAPPAPKGKRVAALLAARGLEGRAATSLARALKERSDAPLDDLLRQGIRSMLEATCWPLPARSGERLVVAAVGMSGVGKTTTLAKLATHARRLGVSVGIVTCDTFRVGAVEQTKRYAALLDVPFETTRTISELEAYLRKTRADLVIVDTSGRPPAADAAEQLLSAEAFSRSDACAPFGRHVLLSIPASSREVDVLRAAKSLAVTNPTALAITKLDETSQPSGVVHASATTRLPIALTCAGPRVPEDLSTTNIDSLIDQLVPRTDSTKARAA